MKRLIYLKYCIKESLRLFPPVCVVGRVLDQDTNITGHVMPKGTSVVLYIHTIHRHPDFWENPDVRIIFFEGW
jgi:cytochrome P450